MFHLVRCCIPALFLLFSFSVQGQTDSFMHNGIMRTYAINVPDNYHSGVQFPLVLNLHGAGTTGALQRFYSQFDAVSDTGKFLVVYPDGINMLWNSGFAAPYGSGVDDVGFLSALIDTMHAHYNIDINRVYSTGMSNGGFMSYMLACELNDRIAAIASVTGSFADSALFYCNPTQPFR